jgi:hypothetical protein
MPSLEQLIQSIDGRIDHLKIPNRFAAPTPESAACPE